MGILAALLLVFLYKKIVDTKLKCGIGKTKLPGLVDRLVY